MKATLAALFSLCICSPLYALPRLIQSESTHALSDGAVTFSSEGADALTHGESLLLNLPGEDPVVVAATPMRASTLESLTLSGSATRSLQTRTSSLMTARGKKVGSIILSTVEDRSLNTLFAVVRDERTHKLVTLRSAAEGTLSYKVRDVAQSAIPRCRTSQKTVPAGILRQRAPLNAQAVTSCDGTNVLIHVLIAYTSRAASAVGGIDSLLAEVATAETLANAAYANSGINQRIQVVSSVEVGGTENGDFDTDLDNLTYNDGKWDNLLNLRDQYGADMVSLLINSQQLCGLAWSMNDSTSDFSDYMFSVISSDDACIADQTFAHELGHNMGAGHDRANNSDGLYSDSFGWRFTGNDGVLYKDVMAYDPGKTVNYFSNPAVSYRGTATGVSGSANNARALRFSGSIISAYRSPTNLTPACPGGTPTPVPTLDPNGYKLSIKSQRSGRRYIISGRLTSSSRRSTSRIAVVLDRSDGSTAGRTRTDARGVFKFAVTRLGNYLTRLQANGDVFSNTVHIRR